MVSIAGLGSGLDTNGIIQQLVAVEQQKIDEVSARSTAEGNKLSTWGTIRGSLTTFSGAAFALQHATDWQAVTATSSDANSVAVTSGAGTMAGSLSFAVTSLAASGISRSTNVLSSLSTKVASDQAVLVSAGGKKLGFSALASDDSVALGTHTIQVTQASSGATKVGSAPLAASVVLNGGSNDIQMTVNGNVYDVAVANGTYTPTSLVTALQTAAQTAGAPVTFSLSASGALQVATTSEGTTASLQVTGGSLLPSVSWTTDAQASTGTAGQVTVDGGVAQTFGNGSLLTPGNTIALAVPAGGTITATLSGGLRVGTLTTNNVSVADGTLGSVVAAINSANAGVTATAVQVASNQYRLQLAANSTGANSDPSIAASEFDPTNVGGLTTLTAGTDAAITVGSGVGSYSITSSSNTLSGVMPGVTMTLKALTASPVTVTVAPDGNTLADKVQKLVDAANAVKSAVDKATAYDTKQNIGSPLTGDSTARRLQSDVYSAMAYVVAGASPSSPGLAGVSVDRNGNYTFDRSKFLTAYNANQTGMANLFTQWGSSSSGSVSFIAATDSTVPGTYAVNVTTPAAQAFSSSGGAIANGTTVRARVGTTIAAYTVQPADTPTTIAAGLNAAFSSQSLALVASVNGGSVEIRTAAYGTNATMDVAWNGTSYRTYHGTDVAGTINGVTATGNGQILTAPQTDTTLAGLALKVVATAAGSAGTFTYTQGIAARASAVVKKATDSISGYITADEAGITAVQKLIDAQVTKMSDSLDTYQQQLKAQFTQLDTAMADLKQQQAWLQSQLAGLG